MRLIGILGRALRRPRLLPQMARAAWRFRARGWWRRAPFLPVPPREYLDWRMHTAYGNYDAIPPVKDVVRYARWAVKAP
jgi:hypothetical protein